MILRRWDDLGIHYNLDWFKEHKGLRLYPVEPSRWIVDDRSFQRAVEGVLVSDDECAARLCAEQLDPEFYFSERPLSNEGIEGLRQRLRPQWLAGRFEPPIAVAQAVKHVAALFGAVGAPFELAPTRRERSPGFGVQITEEIYEEQGRRIVISDETTIVNSAMMSDVGPGGRSLFAEGFPGNSVWQASDDGGIGAYAWYGTSIAELARLDGLLRELVDRKG